MSKKLLWLLLIPVVLVLAYLLGPDKDFAQVTNEPLAPTVQIDAVDQYLLDRETNTPSLKPNNEARIIWYDSLQQTDYSIVYLHGFSASQQEGDPVHRNLAQVFGCNLYLTRLPHHGVVRSNIFLDLTPEDLVNEAREAVAIGKVIGKKVILMSCSTGGTLSLYLSAGDPDIHAEILFSPNISLFHPMSKHLNDPWGLTIARQTGGGLYNIINYNDKLAQYWTGRYRWEGVVALQELIEQTMTTETFSAVTHPIYCAYYYRDEVAQDQVVSVGEILSMSKKLGTPDEKKRFKAFANGTNHVLLYPLLNENWQDVQDDVAFYMEERLDLPRVNELPKQ